MCTKIFSFITCTCMYVCMLFYFNKPCFRDHDKYLLIRSFLSIWFWSDYLITCWTLALTASDGYNLVRWVVDLSVYRSGPHVAAYSCQCSDFNETKKTSGWPDEVQGQTSKAYVWGVEWNEGTCTYFSGASFIQALSVSSPNVWIGEASKNIKCVCCYPKW